MDANKLVAEACAYLFDCRFTNCSLQQTSMHIGEQMGVYFGCVSVHLALALYVGVGDWRPTTARQVRFDCLPPRRYTIEHALLPPC